MVAFPPFRLDTNQERLWKGETPLTLRRKPFAILRYLVEHPKKLVTHAELLAHVWRGAVVSESAMRSHMHELRQVLGEGIIETVIGRGYRFIAPITGDDVAIAESPTRPNERLVVCRDRELETLHSALQRARTGSRQLCFITGDPGIGKSTLVHTFLSTLDPSAACAVTGSCIEQHGTPEPYLAIIDALTTITRSSHGQRVLAALVRYAPTFVAQVPHLVDDNLLDEVRRRAAGGNESRHLREISEAIEAICTVDPLVLVLEDLQWADVATIDLLSFLGQRKERAKLLVIGTSRHAEIQSQDHPLHRVLRTLVARSGAIPIQVPKIDTSGVHRFIDQRFSGHLFPQAFIELVAKITGGTPLFMVSLLDELVGRSMITQQEGRWALSVSIDEVQAHRPASVKQLIDMQIDRLTPTEQRTLEAASIVGTEFSTNLVAAALESSVELVDETCDSLVRRSLFLRTEPDDRYGMTHALVQEVCVDRSSPVRRQRWNRLIADALRRDPRAGEVSHLLAKHYDAAGDIEQAVPAYLAAGRLAAKRYAIADALALCGRALELLPRLPESQDRDRLELQILSTMCRQVSSNDPWAPFCGRDPVDVHTRAIEIARSLNDPASLYAAISQRCSYNMIIAQYDISAELTLELEQLEKDHFLDPELLQSGIFARGYIAFFRGQLSAAQRLFKLLIPSESEVSVFGKNLSSRALSLGHLACVHWVQGETDRALEEAFETIELATKIKIPILVALGHVVRARIRFLRRDPLDIVEKETALALEAASLDLGLLMEAKACDLTAKARRSPLLLEHIQPMVDSLYQRLTEVSTCSTLVALMLIEALTLSGHFAQATELSDKIIAFALARNEIVYLPELLRVRGEQRSETDPLQAERDFEEAIRLAQNMGAQCLELRATGSLNSLRHRPLLSPR